MNLIVLVLALGLSAVLINRLLGGVPVAQPQHPAGPAPTPIHQARRAVDAAARADRQRLDQALKALDPDASP